MQLSDAISTRSCCKGGGGGRRAAGPSYIAYTQFAVNTHNFLNVFLMARADRHKVLGRQHSGIAVSNRARITSWCRLVCIKTT